MNKVLIFLILILGTQKIYSQKIKEISVAAMSEAVGLPFTNYSPYHPGFEIKGTFKKVEKSKSISSLSGRLGFFYHRKLANGIYLGGEYQYSRKLFNKSISLDFPVGLGYLHTFYPGEIYEQTENGEFQQVNQFGRAHLYFNVGFGISYLKNKKINPFIRQELLVETFGNAIIVVPHSLIKIGVIIKIKNNAKK